MPVWGGGAERTLWRFAQAGHSPWADGNGGVRDERRRNVRSSHANLPAQKDATNNNERSAGRSHWRMQQQWLDRCGAVHAVVQALRCFY